MGKIPYLLKEENKKEIVMESESFPRSIHGALGLVFPISVRPCASYQCLSWLIVLRREKRWIGGDLAITRAANGFLEQLSMGRVI